MSFIVINGIPPKWTLPSTVKVLAPVIRGNFTALNFDNYRKNHKNLYIELSKYLDPYEVVAKISSSPIKRNNFKARVVNEVPESVLKSKGAKIPFQMRKKMQIRDELTPELTLEYTHSELVTELQSRFTGLYNLSLKTEHKLLKNLAEDIFTRLTDVMGPSCQDNAFLLSKAYRKKYPYDGDFEFILSTYKKLGGDTIDEEELTNENLSTHPYAIDNVPYDKIKTICNTYSNKVSSQVTSYLQGLQVEPDLNADTEDDIARKKVRVELKKIIPYLPTMIKQVIAQHFIPEKSPYHRVRIYGYPFLPPKSFLDDMLKRHHAVKITRSDRMCNLLKFNIPARDYGSLMAMNNTLIGGAKLVVRSSEMPLYTIPQELVKKIKTIYLDKDKALDDEMFDQDIGEESFDAEIMDDAELVDEDWAEDP